MSAGYLFNDNRAAGGALEEADMLGCNHCQKLMEAKKWRSDGGFCGHCGRPVCGPCADKIMAAGCTPFIERVNKRLAALARQKQNARILGL